MSINLKSEVIFERTIENPPNSGIDWEVGILSSSDIKYYQSSNRYSDVDIQRLQEADYCVVVRKDSVPVHHTCLAVGPEFNHPRKQLTINIGENEGYIYNVKTKTEHRGKGIAPAVFRYIDSLSATRHLERVYADVGKKNKASKKAFKKAGYHQSGIVRRLQRGSKTLVVVQGTEFYRELHKIPLMNIYFTKYQSTRQERIKREIEEFAEVWNKKNQSVVLFGAGNHAEELLELQSVRSAVSYAIDESDDKIGSVLAGGEVTVRHITAVKEAPPDVVVVCSRAFQQEMVDRIKEYVDSTQILTLYPEVNYE